MNNSLNANPNPKYNYLESKRSTELLIDNITRYYEKRGCKTGFSIWSERETIGDSYIWVVRSNIAQRLYDL